MILAIILLVLAGIVYLMMNSSITYTTTPSSKLYLFTTHTFTHARATGRNGPTLDAVRRAYATIGWAQDTTNKYLDMK